MRNKTRIPLLPFLLNIEVLATAIKEEKEMCFVCVCVCVCARTCILSQVWLPGINLTKKVKDLYSENC